jgi:hypothetical protein
MIVDADRSATESPDRHDGVRSAALAAMKRIRRQSRLLTTRVRKAPSASKIWQEVEREDCDVIKQADIRHC